MTDETCGRVVARPNIIAVLDLPGRHFAAGRLSLNSTAMLKMPPGFNSEIVSKGVGSIQEARPQKLSQNRGSLHPGKCGYSESLALARNGVRGAELVDRKLMLTNTLGVNP